MRQDEKHLYRDGDRVIVEAPWSVERAAIPGVEVVDAGAPEDERVVRKVFTEKCVYFPGKFDQACAEVLRTQPDAFVIGPNGYSNTMYLASYQIHPGAYERACAAILARAVKVLRSRFPSVPLRFASGASDIGIDAVTEEFARRQNIPCLGFSCPSYLFYVSDGPGAVYVAEDVPAYADAFVRALDLLLCTGGGEQSLQHDILAACRYDKRLHFVDVPSMLTPPGVSVPARIVNGTSGKVLITNAAAAFGSGITYWSAAQAIVARPADGDRWDALYANVSSVVTDACRRHCSPDRAFEDA